MKAEINIINDVEVIVKPSGNIDFSNSQKLKKDLLDIFDNGYKKVRINFEKVSRIDSSALGKLLLFHKRLREKNGKLIIENVKSSYVKNMFDVINLHKVIEIKD
ncbi:MAG: STAS domain-containing protein [Bacillota bacterium]